MVKVDFKKFFTDRVWFGWWYRPPYRDRGHEGASYSGRWVHDPNPKFQRVIMKFRDAVNVED